MSSPGSKKEWKNLQGKRRGNNEKAKIRSQRKTL